MLDSKVTKSLLAYFNINDQVHIIQKGIDYYDQSKIQMTKNESNTFFNLKKSSISCLEIEKFESDIVLYVHNAQISLK